MQIIYGNATPGLGLIFKKNYAINTILANNMKENSVENNTKAVEIKRVFCIYLNILILATYVVLVDNHSNKV